MDTFFFYTIPRLVLPLYRKDQPLRSLNISIYNFSPLWHLSFKRWYFEPIVSLKSLEGQGAICLIERVLLSFQPAKGFVSSFHVDLSETAWIFLGLDRLHRCWRQILKTTKTQTWTTATLVKHHYLGRRIVTKPWQRSAGEVKRTMYWVAVRL